MLGVPVVGTLQCIVCVQRLPLRMLLIQIQPALVVGTLGLIVSVQKLLVL